MPLSFSIDSASYDLDAVSRDVFDTYSVVSLGRETPDVSCSRA
jgi:hypothetical protein